MTKRQAVEALDNSMRDIMGKDVDLHNNIDSVFLMLDANLTDPTYIKLRAILSTQNKCVYTFNMKIIGYFQGDKMPDRDDRLRDFCSPIGNRRILEPYSRSPTPPHPIQLSGDSRRRPAVPSPSIHPTAIKSRHRPCRQALAACTSSPIIPIEQLQAWMFVFSLIGLAPLAECASFLSEHIADTAGPTDGGNRC
ncbi:uncharacterized protein LOC133884881 [Phragmites australis]|uniref:uncharacterized protein LOC133884881 n=1 Tax=Phragmites australis TaxID=29695 RepID=UPI002D77E87F|nr:uncharacterized protein LOC133884881 [Phragmites australis]